MPITYAVEWGEGRRRAFLDWIQHEIFQTQGDRADLEKKWENEIVAWRAKLSDTELDFPYPGAANYEMPQIAMHSDPVYADLMQSIHAPEDYWTPQAKRDDRTDAASALRRGLTAIERRFLKMRGVNGKAFLDTVLLGTGVYKTWWRSEKRARRIRGERQVQVVSEPSIRHIPIQRLFFPAYAWSLDPDKEGGAPWVSEQHRFTADEWNALRTSMKDAPGWVDEDAEIISMKVSTEDEKIRRQTETDDKFRPFKQDKIILHEVEARFDVRGDGVFEDILVWIQLDGPTMPRAIYNPAHHGKRLTSLINYLPGYGILGIGMAEIDMWSQEAATDLLNAQIDNARLANTRMFKAPLGASFQQNASVYPGKVWYVGPDEDVGEVRLSEIYPSGFTLLQNLMQFSELRSGVSELRQGNLSGLPSRTPATSLLSILREGNKRFDMVHSSIRDVHSDMGLRNAQNIAQHAQDDAYRWQAFFTNAVGPKDAAEIMRVLLQPDVDEIEEAFGISVTATSAQVNKEVEKQSFISMLQITQQIYQALVQTALLMAQVPDPVVRATASAAFTSGVDILGQLFERFDVRNPQEHLGALEAVASQMEQGSMQGMGGSFFDQSNLGILGPGGGPPQSLNQNTLASLLGVG